MRRRTVLRGVAAAGILPLAAACGAAGQPDRLNIVYILVDDMGYSDVACYGSDFYETPNIDALAAEGMLFTSHYAASTLSSPTRASILTGKYPGRLHITHAIPIKGFQRIEEGKGTPLMDADYTMNLPLEEYTIAEALRAAGYSTASVGKWHVCDDPEFYPEFQGFDINIGGNNRGNTGDYFYPYKGRWRMAKGFPWIEWQTLPDGEPDEYLTDRLTREAVKFIEDNKQGPFFLYFPQYAVHTPIQAHEAMIEKYRAKLPDTLRGHFDPGYAAMIESVDRSVGAVVAKLRELGIYDNTAIIFTSDNGGLYKVTSNWPFRGNKGNFYEGGIRVPLIVRWPGVTGPGSRCDVPAISTDHYPTMLSMAGLPLLPEQHLDGLTLEPLLAGKGRPERDELYWHFPNYTGSNHLDGATPQSVIRWKDYKLIEKFEEWSVELYDLAADPQEQHEISALHPRLVEDLRARLAAWRREARVQMPGVNPDYEPKKQ